MKIFLPPTPQRQRFDGGLARHRCHEIVPPVTREILTLKQKLPDHRKAEDPADVFRPAPGAARDDKRPVEDADGRRRPHQPHLTPQGQGINPFGQDIDLM